MQPVLSESDIYITQDTTVHHMNSATLGSSDKTNLIKSRNNGFD